MFGFRWLSHNVYTGSGELPTTTGQGNTITFGGQTFVKNKAIANKKLFFHQLLSFGGI
jgi:hypothetical protein